jgi:hypothetical protein
MIERAFYKEHERIYDVCGVDRKTQQVELLINDICIGVPLNMVTLLLNTQKTDIFGENIFEGDLIAEESSDLPIVRVIKNDGDGFYAESLTHERVPLEEIVGSARIVGNVFDDQDGGMIWNPISLRSAAR